MTLPALALPPNLYVGTSSFTAERWTGPFYPQNLPASERLTFYAQHFRSVEIDSTWYGAPRPNTVAAWREKTPDDFLFAAKVPKVITHDRVLVDCETDLELFVEVMRGLGEKLGPLLLQFPHFSGKVFPDLAAFLARPEPFLAQLPPDLQWAVEVRNRPWLAPPLYAVLPGNPGRSLTPGYGLPPSTKVTAIPICKIIGHAFAQARRHI